MTESTRHALTAVAVSLATLCSGCSFAIVRPLRPAPDGGEAAGEAPPVPDRTCAGFRRAAPYVDLAGAAGYAGLGAMFVALDHFQMADATSHPQEPRLFAIGAFGVGAGLLASSVYGFVQTSRCPARTGATERRASVAGPEAAVDAAMARAAERAER